MNLLPRLFLVMTLSTAVLHADILVKSGEKVAFMGDSITEGGWGNPRGYVRLVMAGLAANGVSAEAVPVGISGNKSNQMLERLERDVLARKPQWMTLSCGVNDVWHGVKGVPLEQYKDNITKIVEQCTAAGVKVVMLTATVIQEKLDNPENEKLAGYNDFLRQLAKDKNLPLADLNEMFQERIKTENKPDQRILTADGVHMNDEGNKVMARGVLKAFGLDDAQLAKAATAWAEIK
jgi:lysophospholipase L1-like esterase